MSFVKFAIKLDFKTNGRVIFKKLAINAESSFCSESGT